MLGYYNQCSKFLYLFSVFVSKRMCQCVMSAFVTIPECRFAVPTQVRGQRVQHWLRLGDIKLYC